MATEHPAQVGVAVPGEHASEAGAFPPFDQANFSSMIIWLVLTFGLLYLLMSKVALPRIHDILHERMGKINGDIKEANRMRREADEAAVAHERSLSDAKAKAQALAAETHATLAAESDARRHSLEADLNAKLSTSETHIAVMKERALASVSAIAEEAAGAIVQRLTGKPADPQAVSSAVAQSRA